MLQWSVDALLASGRVDEVVVVVPPDWVNAPPSYLMRRGVRVVAGGERRQDSVANGFDAVSAASDVVLVHDAARPFVSAAMIDGAIDAAAEIGAAIVAVPARDTVKWSPATAAEAGPDAGRLIARTLSRESIYLAQTPQAFRRRVLQEAIALGRQGVEVTDEAALVEQAGHPVRLVEGSVGNMKVTTAEDLVIAEALLNAKSTPSLSEQASAPALRVGSGYDLHRLVAGRPLVLGGVAIPFDRGLAGHSDADALCHAVTDAILGAASEGDIGQHFPDSDERWRGVSSIDLLRQAAAVVAGRGYRVVNIDATIIAERPKLGSFRDAMTSGLASAIGVEPSAVSVKAKTNEGVDAAGRGEAIAVHAVALLQRDRLTTGH